MASVAPSTGDERDDQYQALLKCKVWEKMKRGDLHKITMENVQELHNVLDTDEAGEISVEHLSMLSTVPELNLTEDDIDNIKVDCDADGSGKVSVGELYEALTLGKISEKINIDNLNKANRAIKPNECTREGLVEWMNHEHETSSSLWSLPQTIMLFFMFLTSVIAHTNIETGFKMQASLQGGVEGENAPHYDLYTYVHDIPSFWEWMQLAWVPMLWKDLDGGVNPNFPYPGRLESYSQIIGGIQMIKTDIHAGNCDQGELLSTFYDQVFSRCHTNNAPITDSRFILYHERGSDVAQMFDTLDKELWLSQNTTELTQQILFYNAYLNAFTFFQQTFYLGGLMGNNKKEGIMHIKFNQETFLADPYWSAVHDGKLWLLLSDLIFIGILSRMLYTELVELLPACMNGPKGFAAYWDVWNVIDWISMMLSFACIAVWIVICVWVSGSLQESIEKLPTPMLDEIIYVNKTYFSKESLESTVDRQGFEAGITEVQEIAGTIASLHSDLRTLIFFNSFILMMKFFKAFRANPRLNVVIMTIEHATVDLIHFMLVFMTIFMVYAVMGYVMFGFVCPQFHTFYRACMMCWRILMGDDIVEDMEIVGTHWAWLWVVTFQGLVGLVLLNMVVAIVMDSYMAVNTGSNLTIWKQTREAIQTIRETRGFLDLWYMICEFKDEEEPAHPGPKVTARSLRRAFERDKMTKANAEYLVRKTQEFTKEREEKDEVGIKEGLSLMSQVRTLSLKIQDASNKTLDMVTKQVKAPQEARFDAIIAGHDPDSSGKGFGASTAGSFGGMGGMRSNMMNTGFGNNSATGNGFGNSNGFHSNGFGATSNGVHGNGFGATSNGGFQGVGMGNTALVGVQDKQSASNGDISPNLGAESGAIVPRQIAPGIPMRQSSPLALSDSGMQTNGSQGFANGFPTGNDAINQPQNALVTTISGPQPQQMPMMGGAQNGMMVGMMQQMRAQMQMMGAQMAQMSGQMETIFNQANEQAKAAAERNAWMEQRITALERRSERVEKTSEKLREQMLGFDFRELDKLPRKTTEAVSMHMSKVQAQFVNELSQYRSEVGAVAEMLGTQLHRERGLHELIDKMETDCAGGYDGLRGAASVEPNFAEMHDLVDRFFGQSAAMVNNGLQAREGAVATTRASTALAPASSELVSRPTPQEGNTQQGNEAGSNMRGTPSDNMRRLENRISQMGEQVTSLLSHAEEQAQARQMLWRIDLSLRELRNKGVQQQMVVQQPQHNQTSQSPGPSKRLSETYAAGPGPSGAGSSNETGGPQVRKIGRLVTKNSQASGATARMAGDSVIRTSTPPEASQIV